MAATGAVGLVALIAVVLVAVGVGSGGSNTEDNAGTYPLTSALQASVTNVPLSTMIAAAKPEPPAATPPQQLPGQTKALYDNGKPEILYMGADYCPYCAAERWVLVMALSKFGIFSPLRGTASSSSDTFPGTPTFTFYGSSYTSRYLSFVPVEMETQSGAQLQIPTGQQKALLTKWDVAPWTPEEGAIPFIYLGGRYLLIDSQYLGRSLSGMTFEAADSYLTSGTNVTSKAALASAGYLVGDLCALTHSQPATVCSKVPRALIGITTATVKHTTSTSTTGPATTVRPARTTVPGVTSTTR
jgi:hypothetical protein